MGIRSGKGENIGRKHTLHISENMPSSIAIIATFMATMRKRVGNFISR
jgi:hypothetical protein